MWLMKEHETKKKKDTAASREIEASEQAELWQKQESMMQEMAKESKWNRFQETSKDLDLVRAPQARKSRAKELDSGEKVQWKFEKVASESTDVFQAKPQKSQR